MVYHYCNKGAEVVDQPRGFIQDYLNKNDILRIFGCTHWSFLCTFICLNHYAVSFVLFVINDAGILQD